MENSFWEKVIIEYNTEFHLLRHFENPSKSCQLRLQENGYSQEQIDKENKIPGSKFHSLFATDIYELLSLIKKHRTVEKSEFKNSFYLNYQFEKSEYLSGIGENSIMNLDVLTNDQKSQIYISDIRGYSLQYLKVDHLPKCWEATIILRGEYSNMRLISAFPGLPGLPLPKAEMDEKTKKDCVEFWNEHVILTSHHGPKRLSTCQSKI